MNGELPKRPNPEKDFYPKQVADRTAEYVACMERLDFSGALGIIWAVVGQLNERVNNEAPWKLFKSAEKADHEKAKILLFDVVWCLRILGGWLEPFMPRKVAEMQARLGVRQYPDALSPDDILQGKTNGVGKIQKGPPLFPRKA